MDPSVNKLHLHNIFKINNLFLPTWYTLYNSIVESNCVMINVIEFLWQNCIFSIINEYPLYVLTFTASKTWSSETHNLIKIDHQKYKKHKMINYDKKALAALSSRYKL